jgi:hypothetical protein
MKTYAINAQHAQREQHLVPQICYLEYIDYCFKYHRSIDRQPSLKFVNGTLRNLHRSSATGNFLLGGLTELMGRNLQTFSQSSTPKNLYLACASIYQTNV